LIDNKDKYLKIVSSINIIDNARPVIYWSNSTEILDPYFIEKTKKESERYGSFQVEKFLFLIRILLIGVILIRFTS
jgi:hypothetical protein